MSELPHKQTAEFLVVASTLLLIKSKSLLPGLDLTVEEEGDIRELEMRLEQYSIYVQGIELLSEHIKVSKRLYSPIRTIKTGRKPVMPTQDKLNISILYDNIRHLIDNLPVDDTKGSSDITTTVDIKQVMQNLLSRVERNLSTTFSNLNDTNKSTILLNFLALLELVKDGVLVAEQCNDKGDILIRSKSSVI
jgi:segregation and condensation protein A